MQFIIDKGAKNKGCLSNISQLIFVIKTQFDPIALENFIIFSPH